jgi:hypothetical protein
MLEWLPRWNGNGVENAAAQQKCTAGITSHYLPSVIDPRWNSTAGKVAENALAQQKTGIKSSHSVPIHSYHLPSVVDPAY